MSDKKIPSWKEVGERLVKGAVFVVGQEILTKEILPAASIKARKAWEKFKSKKEAAIEPQQIKPQKSYKQAVIKNQSKTPFVVDAEFLDEEKNK